MAPLWWLSSWVPTTDQTRRRASSSTATISSRATRPLAKVTVRAALLDPAIGQDAGTEALVNVAPVAHGVPDLIWRQRDIDGLGDRGHGKSPPEVSRLWQIRAGSAGGIRTRSSEPRTRRRRQAQALDHAALRGETEAVAQPRPFGAEQMLGLGRGVGEAADPDQHRLALAHRQAGKGVLAVSVTIQPSTDAPAASRAGRTSASNRRAKSGPADRRAPGSSRRSARRPRSVPAGWRGGRSRRAAATGGFSSRTSSLSASVALAASRWACQTGPP
jgi:hypothetical protein